MTLDGALQRGLLVGDEVEDVDFSGSVEMLGDFEELHGKQRVEALFQRRLALLEGQFGDVAEKHVLVEATVLIEVDAEPEVIAGGGFECVREDLASHVVTNGRRKR